VRPVFADVPEIRLLHLGDATAELAGRKAAAFGFERATGDWRAVVNDPELEVISLTTPTALHTEMAITALEAGKRFP
jgi:predicted dehydrogenase